MNDLKNTLRLKLCSKKIIVLNKYVCFTRSKWCTKARWYLKHTDVAENNYEKDELRFTQFSIIRVAAIIDNEIQTSIPISNISKGNMSLKIFYLNITKEVKQHFKLT